MNLGLNKKIALVAGSSHGIGRAIAKTLISEGAQVIICGRDKSALATTKKEFLNIKGPGRVLGVYTVQATDQKSVRSLFKQIRAKFKNLDILVNSIGGVEKFGTIADLKDSDWENAWKLNFLSAEYFCEEAIPLLKKSSVGKIVNIASMAGLQPGRFNPHYSAAKAALLNYTKHLANELAPYNILANSICPNSMSGHRWQLNIADGAKRLNISLEQAEKDMLIQEQKKNPLGRIGSEEDIAYLTAFLVSDKAQFITGESFRVDGGASRSL